MLEVASSLRAAAASSSRPQEKPASEDAGFEKSPSIGSPRTDCASGSRDSLGRPQEIGQILMAFPRKNCAADSESAVVHWEALTAEEPRRRGERRFICPAWTVLRTAIRATCARSGHGPDHAIAGRGSWGSAGAVLRTAVTLARQR